MGDNELLIKLNADAKNFNKALDDAAKKTEDLEKNLNTMAKIGGAIFAATTVEIGLAVHAFIEANIASEQLTASLQQQGIFTEKLAEQYKGFADAVQAKTGVDNDAIIASQATLQSYLGETKITKELTGLVVDLAEKKKIDLNSAAALVGKTIGGTTNALAREGLELDSNASKSEKLAQVTEFLNLRVGGTAEAAEKGGLGIKGMVTAFGNLQEAIGEKFAPVVATATNFLTGLFNAISGSKELVNLTVSIIAATAAVSGAAVAIALGAKAFIFFKGVLAAFAIQTAATKVAVQALIGATGLGLLVIAVTEIALHWNTIFPRIQKVFQAFVSNITKLGGGLSKFLLGIFKFDKSAITEGLDEVKKAFADGLAEATADVKPIEPPKVKQDEKKKAFARQQQTKKETKEIVNDFAEGVGIINKGAAGVGEGFAKIAGLIGESLLPGIGGAVSQVVGILAQGPAKVKETFDAFFANIPVILENIILAIPAAIQSIVLGLSAAFERISERLPEIITQFLDAIVGLFENEQVIQALVFAGNKFSLELTKQAPFIALALAQELIKQGPFIMLNFQVELIKQIPKIVESFATEFLKIPGEFGKKLLAILPGGGGGGGGGVVGAIGGFLGFAEGGIIQAAQGAFLEGGVTGVDSIPVLGQTGELVVPKQNFEEVINSVKATRESKDAEILTTLQQILAKIGAGGNNITVNGDVLSSTDFVRTLMSQIVEQLEFGNGTLTPATGV